MPEELRILHYASLAGVGGVERYLTGFLSHRSPRWSVRHGVELFEREHPFFRDVLRRHTTGVYYPKSVGPLKIPKWPRGLREGYHRHVARRYAPGIGLIWNLLGDVRALARARAGGLTTVYWERGLAWFDDQGPEKIKSFLGDVDAVIANSHAGARVLQLGWGYDGPVEVCRNALRADASPPRAEPKRLASDRPLQLGACGRLEPFKGMSLAIHALAELVRGGVDAQLTIAGSGALARELDAVVRGLDMQERVTLAGELDDVEPFYESIDILLHPALREPCANVVPEAMARGCPVVAGAVDGMPELVEDGVTGVVLPPTLPLSDYAGFGGHVGRMPLWVYDPLDDRLGEPRLVEPTRIADAVRGYVEHPERYREHSAAALAAVRERFDSRVRLEEVLDTLHGFLERDTQAPPLSAAASR